jgi:o-succinylbenzoate synthase
MEVVLEGLELRRIQLPLAETFRAAHGVRDHREAIIVRAMVRHGAPGWSECVAEGEPTYWPEYTDGAWHVLEHHLVPRVLAGQPMRQVRGHQMAKAAVEMAALDAGLRAQGQPLSEFLGATRREVPTGIALGITPTIDALVDDAVRWCSQGHRALKLKITPGWDVDAVRAVRTAVGPETELLLDANGSYSSEEPEHLAILTKVVDPSLGIAAIEQPFPPDDLRGHARLARQIAVPVCLDESIGSLGEVETALAMQACGAINLKAGRVGGLVETRRIHQRCFDEGVALRCGGMLETGLGRAANLAVAALPGCTLPPDLGPSSRYYVRDITEPLDAQQGMMRVPSGSGLGVEPNEEVLDEMTVDKLVLRASR